MDPISMTGVMNSLFELRPGLGAGDPYPKPDLTPRQQYPAQIQSKRNLTGVPDDLEEDGYTGSVQFAEGNWHSDAAGGELFSWSRGFVENGVSPRPDPDLTQYPADYGSIGTPTPDWAIATDYLYRFVVSQDPPAIPGP